MGNDGLRSCQYARDPYRTTKGQYASVQREQVSLVSSLLYGTKKKHTNYGRFHGNGLCGKILTKKEQKKVWRTLLNNVYLPQLIFRNFFFRVFCLVGDVLLIEIIIPC